MYLFSFTNATANFFKGKKSVLLTKVSAPESSDREEPFFYLSSTDPGNCPGSVFVSIL